MKDKEIYASLNEVDSLNDSEKESFTDMSLIATNDISSKRGRANKIILNIGEREGYLFELNATKKNNTRKPYPKAEDKLKSIGLSAKVTKKIIEEINNGKINSTHITDLQKLPIADELINLDDKAQEEVIDRIIQNRNERNIINSEEIAIYAVRNRTNNAFTFDIWYKSLIRCLKKLSELINVDNQAIDKLSLSQRKTLNTLIMKIIKELQSFKIKLD